MRRCALRLTESALRYARRHRLEGEIERLGLGADCLTGDVVSIETGERPHDFVILARRWAVTSDGRRLELTLDHPARRPRV
ncbi:MAG: hypothetical protein AB7S92_11640 [Parvibaculaceae bacterium]